jgi:hypothetical protein
MMTVLLLGVFLTDASLIESPGIFVLMVLVNSMVLMALSIPSLITSTVLRGGVLFRLTGVAVVNSEGHVIPRYRALWRSLVAWCPALLAAVITFTHLLRPGGIAGPMAGAAAALSLLLVMLAGVIWCIIVPSRGPQDWLARTYLVPR